MPTEILCGCRYLATEVGFCKEEPKEVLRVVFPNYVVVQYRDINLVNFGYSPKLLPTKMVDNLYGPVPKRVPYRYNNDALFISDARIPRGLKVESTLDELLQKLQEKEKELADLGESAIGYGTGHIPPGYQRTAEDVREALRELVKRKVGWEYLNGEYDKIEYIKPSIDEQLPQVLDVVEVALNLPNLTLEDLKNVLRPNPSQ